MVCIVDASVSQAIKLSLSVEDILEALNLQEKKVIIMPINDHKDPDKEAGSLWSLLVYAKQLNKFFYYESINNYNVEATLATYNIVAKHFDKPNYPELEILKGPVQDNNFYDCGLYMIMAIEFIVPNLNNSALFQDPLPNITA